MNLGPHQAKAPVTNATHVKPSVDSMNDGFFHMSENSNFHSVTTNRMNEIPFECMDIHQLNLLYMKLCDFDDLHVALSLVLEGRKSK